MGESISIFEVGPRDGLQNEPNFVATADKIKLIDMLSDCGLKRIEATSFVSPQWVPQLADCEQVMAEIKRQSGVTYSVLVPNLKGMERAIHHRADEVAIFAAAASEAFSQKNTNCSIAESFKRFRPVIEMAKQSNIAVRGYVSTIVECPYSGAVAPESVLKVVEGLLELGCYEISLGDTLGSAAPGDTEPLLNCLLNTLPISVLAGHFHDTKGLALQNIELCLSAGMRNFDASIDGLGGCPYAPGATGNVATQSVVRLATSLGYETGVNVDKLEEAAKFIRQLST